MAEINPVLQGEYTSWNGPGREAGADDPGKAIRNDVDRQSFQGEGEAIPLWRVRIGTLQRFKPFFDRALIDTEFDEVVKEDAH